MSLCSTFTDNAECALQLSNTFNMKLTILIFFLIISMYAVYKSKDIVLESYYNVLTYLVIKYSSMAYVFFFPWFLLMLKHSLTFETFLIVLTGFYGLMFAVIIILGLLFGKDYIMAIFSGKAVKFLKSEYRYRNN